MALTHAATHEVGLLGGFALLAPSGQARLGYSAQRLVAMLALDGRALHRDTVAGRLWPEVPQDRARANLRSVVWRLPAPARTVVRAQGETLALQGVGVDVTRLSAFARDMLDALGPRTASRDGAVGEAACDLVHRTDPVQADAALRMLQVDRDLLPGWGDDWVVVERERLRQMRLHALEALCAAQSAVGRHLAAIDTGILVTRLDPMRESAHRALIRAHLAEGNYAEALQQYTRLRRLLRDELGIAPTRATQQLFWPAGDPTLTPA